MSRHTQTAVVFCALWAVVGLVPMSMFAQQAPDPAAVDKALEVLKSYAWGDDIGALDAVEKAVAASQNQAAAKKSLETRLTAVLQTDAPAAAKDVVCRQLSLIGSADCVPALSSLLSDKELTHIVRFALERIPDPEASAALRDALAKTSGMTKVGVINSLGTRRDASSLSSLEGLLGDADPEIVSAAAAALGAIGNADSAKVLAVFQSKAPQPLRTVVADARLACAERLLVAGKKAEAIAIYKALSAPDQPKHVRVACARGLLAAMGNK